MDRPRTVRRWDRVTKETSVTERICGTCGEGLAPQARLCSRCGTPSAGTAHDPTIQLPLPPSEPAPTWNQPPPTERTVPLPPTSPAPGWAQPVPPAPQSSWPVAQAPPNWPGQPQPHPTYPQPGQYGQPPQFGRPQPAAAWPVGQFATLPAAPAQPATGGNIASAVLAFLGGVLFAVGAFAPWVRTRVDSYSGWTASPDAKVVVALAVLAFLVSVILVAGAGSRLVRLVLLAIGATALVLAAVDILSVVRDVADSLDPAIGLGLVLVPIGGALLLLSAALTRSPRT